MSIFILFAYTFKTYVAAQPIPAYDLFGISARDVAPSSIHDLICPETRSIWDVVWGCLVTILACTWVSNHPNIPDKDEGPIRSIFRRMKLMVYAFLVPEFVITWAIRQRLAAAKIAERYKDQFLDNPELWTIKHGFFLQMGGFMLYESGLPKYTLLPQKFQQLLDNDEIDFPRVHERDIADRSKGDFFSKGVVLVQTTWFVVQCIARWAQGLGMTELEVLTLALAVLNGAIYALWLHKPLNVEWHVRVNLKTAKKNHREGSTSQGEVHNDSVLREESAHKDGGDEDVCHALLTESVDEHLLIHTSAIPDGITGDPLHLTGLRNILGGVLSSISESTFIRKFRDRVDRVGLFRCVLGYLVIIPILAIITPIRDMLGNNEIEDEPKCAPMFYADNDAIGDGGGMAFVGGLLLGSIFGAIHCIAWSYQFPSHCEQILWRISALAVTAVPIALGGVGVIGVLAKQVPETQKVIKNTVVVLALLILFPSLILYVVARMSLLVLAFISLRSIPTNSLSQIDWVSFVPHI